MIQLLEKYRALTEKQKELLLNDEVDEALRIVEEKDQVFALIQEENARSNGSSFTQETSISHMVQQVLAINHEVTTLMEAKKTALGEDLNKIKFGRRTQGAYGTPYDSDAYFVDKKE